MISVYSVNSKDIIQKNRKYNQLNEILYLFYAAKELKWPYISKIGVQKTIYLSEVLSPFKKIMLFFLNFIYHKRGPYSSDIQNNLDYLVSIGAIEIVKFEKHGKSSFANYIISASGENIVKSLLSYQKEKYDWIKIVISVIDAYKDAFGIGEKFENVDKIIDLVYEEPSFKQAKMRGKGEFIYINLKDNPTMKLLDILKNIEGTDLPNLLKKKPVEDLETIIIMFFEHLYLDFLTKKSVRHE